MPDEEIETTRLLNQPQYAFDNSLLRKRRIRQFQCCLCTIIGIAFLTALVIITAFTINGPMNQPDNGTNVTTDVFLVLFNKQFPIEPRLKYGVSNVTMNASTALKLGQTTLNKRDEIERTTPSLSIQSPSYRHQQVMGTNEKARNLSRLGYLLDGATHYVYGGFLSEDYICLDNFTDDFSKEMCSNDNSSCFLSKYRSYNGSCNNLKFPKIFGAAYRPFRRNLQPDYADGINRPRMSKRGSQLPSARMVSLEIHRPYYRSDSKFSVMLAIWGQFLDHDITATALNKKLNGSSISCCQENLIRSPECFPVFLEQSDPFAQFNVTCMEFVRAAASPKCCLGPREQMNQATAFIDGSVIYGVDESLVNSLRTMSRGLLKMIVTKNNKTLLPLSEDMNDGCNREEEKRKGKYCFATGDSRANENLHLTSMHLIWARQHNLLANTLFELNPHWSDEVIFQETRKIIGAQMQHITYNEFLPIIIGRELMKRHHLLPIVNNNFSIYNESVDPSIANEFASSVFRFAHTLIPGIVKLLRNDTSSPEFIQMRKMLFDPFNLYDEGQLDGTLKGAINSSIESSDQYFSDELKSHLFERKNDPLSVICGLDLVSLNIQRGRDHGLAGYTSWKEFCGLGKSTSFNDLTFIMDPSSLNNIRAVYRDVEDIDLYTGGLSEKPLKENLLGPTFTCLILDQFKRLKFGDRFWYENPKVFTLTQLNEIRKTSLAGIICSNSDNIGTIQPLVMESWKDQNRDVSCLKIPSPNLSMWKESLEHMNIPTNKFNVKVIT